MVRDRGLTVTRRGTLRAAGGAVASAVGTTVGARVTNAQETEASITFNDQRSDGESVVIAHASTSVDAKLLIVTGTSQVFRSLRMEEGTEFSDRTIELTTPIEETQTIRAEIRTADEADELLARDRATIGIGVSPEKIGVRFVEADGTGGFNYPYYLYNPSVEDDREVALLVKPTNTGTSTDDFQQHRDAAKSSVQNGRARRIAEWLNVPLLVPVFPRPRSEPVDWRHYTHQLDRDTLQIQEGPLERIDLQLLSMVDHAINQELADTAYTFREEVMLDGFSASGNFVDRFTVVHSDRVLSVTAGGLNGMAMLPLEEAKGHTLNYHVGIADVESITGESVDFDALSETNQLLYMGAQDDNDTLPNEDAWTSESLQNVAREVYGDDMIADRFPYSQSAYEEAGIPAQFRIYEGIGHRPPQIVDLVEFHRRSLAGEDVADFGRDLSDGAAGWVVTDPPQPAFSVATQNPTVGQQVEFDASATERGDTAVVEYAWDFDDGTTATGESVTHNFSEAGTYAVKLTVTDFFDGTETTMKEITVDQAETATPTEAPEDSGTTTETTAGSGDTTTSSGSGAGFGVGTALTSMLGGIYLLRRSELEGDD